MATSHWFIGGGAEHTAEMVRRDTHAKMGGAEGIVGSLDLRVLPYTVPGGGVRVTTGSAYIQSRYQGSSNQMYMGSVVTQETVQIPQNTTGNLKRYLIAMIVKDPFAPGSPTPAPANPATAQYVFVEAVPASSAVTRLQQIPGYENTTGIALARVDLPASTGTITKGMIVQVRAVARPQREEIVFARPRVAADTSPATQIYLNSATSNGGEYFPGGAGSPNQFEVDVPAWATRMVIDATWINVMIKAAANTYGEYWIEYGDEYRNHTWPNKRQFEFATQTFVWNPVNATDAAGYNWIVMDEVPIPAKLRGKKITFVFKAGITGNLKSNWVYMDHTGGLGCRLTFSERAVDDDIL